MVSAGLVHQEGSEGHSVPGLKASRRLLVACWPSFVLLGLQMPHPNLRLHVHVLFPHVRLCVYRPLCVRTPVIVGRAHPNDLILTSLSL